MGGHKQGPKNIMLKFLFYQTERLENQGVIGHCEFSNILVKHHVQISIIQDRRVRESRSCDFSNRSL